MTGDRPRYQEPGTLGAATLRSRRPPSKSLALGRLQRGVKRQWLMVVLITLIVIGAGLAYDWGSAPILSSLLFWSPIGVAVGLLAGVVRELSRNTVTSLSSFGKNRGYAILGAAPELTDRALRQLAPDKRSPLGCLAFQPSSSFATAFRDLQSAITKEGVVAFTADGRALHRHRRLAARAHRCRHRLRPASPLAHALAGFRSGRRARRRLPRAQPMAELRRRRR
jgi:hypothetical protein